MLFFFIKKASFLEAKFSFLAENQGFEPWQGLHPLAVFETAPFSRLGNSQARRIIHEMIIYFYIFVFIENMRKFKYDFS